MGQAPSSPSSPPCPSQCGWTGCVPPPFFAKRQQRRSRDLLSNTSISGVEPTSTTTSTAEPTAVTTTIESDLTWETNDTSNAAAPRVQSIHAQQLQTSSPQSSPTQTQKRKRQHTIKTLPFAPRPPAEHLSRLVAVDCGMVRIGPRLSKKKKKKKGKKSRNDQQSLALRRVCIVDGSGVPILNETVRVPTPSLSVGGHPHGYQTKLARQLSDHVLPRINLSGDDLNVGSCPDEIRKAAADLIRGKIVVGHSVDGDLAALGLMGSRSHPRHMLRDTSLYPPFLTKKGKSHKLSFLVKERLGRTIQLEGQFHGCREDAVGSLDLYISDWENWERMTACSPLMHTHTSACNLRNNVPAAPTSVLGEQKEVTNVLPKCQDQRTVESETESIPSNQRPNESIRRETKRKRRKRRREMKRASTEKQSWRSFAASILQFPVDLVSSLILFPVHVMNYASAAVSDAARLVAQGPTLAWRVLIVKLGYQRIPKSFPHQRNKRLSLTAKKARVRKRKIVRLLWSLKDAILYSHVILEPVAIIARYQCQEVGIAVFKGLGSDIYNHWGSAVTMIAASLLAASGRDRYTRQSRICFGVLAYYHILFLYSSLERGEWDLDIVAKRKDFVWRGLTGIAVAISHFLDQRNFPGLDDLGTLVHSSIQVFFSHMYLTYHFVFFLYFPLNWMCKHLWLSSK